MKAVELERLFHICKANFGDQRFAFVPRAKSPSFSELVIAVEDEEGFNPLFPPVTDAAWIIDRHCEVLNEKLNLTQVAVAKIVGSTMRKSR